MANPADAATLPDVNASVLNSTGIIPLNGQAQILKESTLTDLTKLLNTPGLNWQPTPARNNDFGLSKHPLWFRIRLSDLNQVESHFYLRINYPHLDRIQVYYVDRSNTLRQYLTGDTLPHAHRPVPDRVFLFPLRGLDTNNIDVYIKVASDGPLRVPLDLITRSTLQTDEKYLFGFYGLYFGIMLVMFFYNLFIYLTVRNPAYLYYLFYVATTTFLQFALLGFGFQWLWPKSTILNNDILLMLTNLMPFTVILFVNEFIMINRFGITWHVWTLRFFLALFGCAFLIAPIGPYMLIFQISHIASLLLLFFVFYLGISYWRKGSSAAKSFTLVWSIYLTFILIYLLEITGIYRVAQFAPHALLIGSAVEITLFAIAFGDQINEQKKRISKLLSATKALSQSTSKIHAAAIAIANLAILSRNIYLKDADLYLPQQNGNALLKYPLWIDGHTQPHPQSYEADESTNTELKRLETTTLQDQELLIPIKADKKVWGYFKISKYRAKASYLVLEMDIIESIIHSLAHTMESMVAEEKERMSMIGSMAAAIVHDLKNPIGAIQGCAQLAKGDDVSKEDLLKYLGYIISESKHLDIMAHEVLEFSSGNLVLDIERHSAEGFILDISQTLQQLFRAANMQYEEHCDVDGGIKMDAERIRRAILNIATNSRDAMAEQNADTAKFSLSITREGDDIVFVAQDSGPGIPQSIQANLFEPFASYGKKQGTGLGMAITKRIIDAHLGQIKFNSSPQGTMFTIILPNAYVEMSHSELTESGSQTAPAHFDFENRSVLLAEDNPVNQTIISKLLTKWKMQVEVVSNGLQAIAQLKSRHFDMVLMDLEMPELDGFEATRIIRNDSQFTNLPIIALTGHTTDDELKKCLTAGVNVVVQKPVDQYKLAEVLQKLL